MQHATGFRFDLLRRFLSLAVLFTLELIPITVWLDARALIGRGELIALLGFSGSWVLRWIIAFATLFVTLAALQMSGDRREDVLRVSERLTRARVVNPTWLAVHLGSLALFGILARSLFETAVSGSLASLVALLWLVVGVTAIVAGACTFIPLTAWRQVLRITGNLWVYALAASLTVCLLGAYARTLWASTAAWTFFIVKGILALFLSGVVTNLSTMSIGTEAFHVEIDSACSGLEGAALILGFSLLWLWLLRREFRFPRALILAPASVLVLFFLNAVRIAALILIGNAGAPEIALGGFHSQAGWIAFNGVAIALMVGARRMQWIAVSPSGTLALDAKDSTQLPVATENPAAPYLVPFLSILAAAMISRAASGGFEWLYPLRFLASGAALWIFRANYRKLDWHFGWEAPAVGTFVFVLWLGGDWVTGVHPQNPFAANADRGIAAAQSIWLVLRVMSSVITVPISEELAFRGYLIRRIVAVDFASLSPRAFTTTSLIISSLAFGILHGERRIAGTIAGLLYAAVLLRRGRIGDAVIAHATTNGLLAASVVLTGQWNLS